VANSDQITEMVIIPTQLQSRSAVTHLAENCGGLGADSQMDQTPMPSRQ